MGNVDDVRKIVQDFVVPDMKAIEARIHALEQEMKLCFTSLEREVNARFTANEKDTGARFASAEQLAASRHETVMSAMAAHHSSIMNALEMEKRLARLESQQGRLESSPH